LDIHFWPQAADWEAEAEMRLKDWTLKPPTQHKDELYAVILDREFCHCDRPHGITTVYHGI
jgi:hypothetical protein